MDNAATRFERACARHPVDRTPLWIMRQAGRYLPEYREIRSRHSLLDICRTPELACEVAMQPLRRFDLDAAILFSDLLIPVLALGIRFDIVEKRGPVLPRPLTSPSDIDALPRPDLSQVSFVFETIRAMRQSIARLGRPIPVIGFAGAPFTVASYLIEGEPTRAFQKTKLMMYREPRAFDRLLDRLSDLAIAHVREQVNAGARAVQIFDSWAGCLGPREYRSHVLAPTRRIFEALKGMGVPSIHFATAGESLLDPMAEAGGDVISVDWRIPLGTVRARHPDRAVQGNLDPLALMAPPEVLRAKIRDVLSDAGPQPGHIFNLGHGILPDTPVEAVELLADEVHAAVPR
ncbi:MAG: uroporphyrinogen decarboxylase [Candidatus Polarisedimenticolia bacterium]